MERMIESDKFGLNNLNLHKNEFLYHLDISCSDNLPKRFGDVKFVCVGGKNSRMRKFAEHLWSELGNPKNSEFEEAKEDFRLKDIAAAGGRYSMFKVGPVISASHGIGSASLSIVLHEMFKLLHFAGCGDVKFFRIGTCGGLGINPGTVVITRKVYDGLLQNGYRRIACGKEYRDDTVADLQMANDVLECAKANGLNAIIGNTLGANDFYEEQARLDGAFCCFTADEKAEFLQRASQDRDIRNIEMESSCFTAFCGRANLQCAVVCAALVDRLRRDDVTSDRKTLAEWEAAPVRLVTAYIKKNL